MSAFSAKGLTVEGYVDLITNERDRAYADRLLAEAVSDLRERYAVILAEGKRSSLCLKYIPEGPMPFRVAQAIQADIEMLVEYEARGTAHFGIYSEYARHLRAVESRRRARAARPKGLDAPRDSQRSRLYNAERVLDDFDQQRWGEKSIPEIQAYVDKILASAWWKRRYPVVKRITVKPGAGHRRASAQWYGMLIHLPLWARKEWVVLHEMAHLATDATYGPRSVAAHGREYARIYVELVGHVLGKGAANALKVSFRSGRVKYSLPRTMTPEQREAAAARLAMARAARTEA